MKTLVFFLTFLLIFSLFSYGEIQIDENPTDTLYIMGGNITTFVFDNRPKLVPPEELICTGDGIQSFNLTTNEIVFTDSIFNILANYPIFNFYLNSKLLLENIVQWRSEWYWYTSKPNDDLMFYLMWDSSGIYNSYLCYCYPSVDISLLYDTPEELRTNWQKRLAENIEMRKEGWELFIKYLSDNNKIIGNETALDPPALPEINDISLYPNPTAGEFRVSGFEFRVADIQVFDIYGIKQFSTFNFQLSTQVDISHLPAGLYFVRITTEKGVVTKKVVKK